MNKEKEEKKYKRAKKRVKELKSFYFHLYAYVAVNLVFLMLNFLTSRGDFLLAYNLLFLLFLLKQNILNFPL